MEDLKEALDRIKSLELEADISAEEAKDRGQKIVREAEEERSRIIEGAMEKAKTDGENLKAEMDSTLAKEIAGIEKYTLEEMEAIKKKAEKNSNKAFDFIMGKIKSIQDGDR